MARRITLLLILLFAPTARAEDTDTTVCTCDVTPAACDANCACDTECDVDWTVDECAAPDSGCLPNDTDPDEATVEANEAAAPVDVDPVVWPTAAALVACPDGATNTNGACVAQDLPTTDGTVTGGCTTGATPRLLIGLAVLALIVIARRRRALLAIAIASCSVGSVTWDDAVDAGPTGETATYLDVYSADLASGSQFLIANQTLDDGALQPAAHFSLLRATGGVPIMRVAGTCGDRLVTSGGELLGWARNAGGDGTAALTELTAPDGCSFAYETDPAAIDDLVAEGYTITSSLGYVWPPGLADMPDVDNSAPETVALAAPATCKITASSAVDLLYASPGSGDTLRFLFGCPGEVIVGDKDENGPSNEMRTAAAHAAGGRTGFVLDRNGDKLRALLNRSNGIERTAAYLRHKLALGYDYIVIDEVTGAPDYADGQALNIRLRQLMLRMPARTIIPYISIDLTQESFGATLMRDRRLLLRSFKLHARVLALEVYLQTGQVMAGEAPSTFRTAVDRIAAAVHDLPQVAGISAHEIITLGTSMHSTYPQYRYLDEPAHDLEALAIEVNAIRDGSHRLRAEHGLGYYFVNKSDMAPPKTYTYDALLRRMRLEALRFK